ncbi:hypothetical protein [Pseudonocardia sp. H11422]|nr:hypothetical protein [Pseudonocardia sp. H11422]
MADPIQTVAGFHHVGLTAADGAAGEARYERDPDGNQLDVT